MAHLLVRDAPKLGLGSEIVALFSGQGISLEEGKRFARFAACAWRFQTSSHDSVPREVYAIMIATEETMAQILVRNLEDQVKGRLQHRAKRNGRSMEEEAREILRNALKAEETQTVGFGTASVALFSGRGIFLDEPIQEIRGMRMQIPDFGS
jgi:plasmid stability protein